MIPPTFPEMRQNVLPGQFLNFYLGRPENFINTQNFVQNAPKMQNIGIPHYQRCDEPINAMNSKIMVQIIHYIR